MITLVNNKRGQIDLETLMTPTFLIITAVGYLFFAITILSFKLQGASKLFPIWMRIVGFLLIPVIAYIFEMIHNR